MARQAGLSAPVVWGERDRKTYIIETVGCGCAFFDYDNDGWLDIFLLCGLALRRMRRRRHQPPVQEQSRRHVHRCHRKGRAAPQRVGFGGHGRRLQQRRLRRPLPHLLGPERSVPQQRRRHVHRRHRSRPGCCTRSRAGARAAPSSTTTATASWTCSSPTTSSSTSKTVPRPGQTRNCNWKGVAGQLRSARPAARHAVCSTATTATARSPMSARTPGSRRRRAAT